MDKNKNLGSKSAYKVFLVVEGRKLTLKTLEFNISLPKESYT